MSASSSTCTTQPCLQCSICGNENVAFSRRQLKKAEMGDPAKCVTCASTASEHKEDGPQLAEQQKDSDDAASNADSSKKNDSIVAAVVVAPVAEASITTTTATSVNHAAEPSSVDAVLDCKLVEEPATEITTIPIVQNDEKGESEGISQARDEKATSKEEQQDQKVTVQEEKQNEKVILQEEKQDDNAADQQQQDSECNSSQGKDLSEKKVQQEKLYFSDGQSVDEPSVQSSRSSAPGKTSRRKKRPIRSLDDNNDDNVDYDDDSAKNQELKPKKRQIRSLLFDDEAASDGADHENSSDEEDDDGFRRNSNDSMDKENFVSLNELKNKVMGRKVELADEVQKKDLAMELECPICHDCLYQPVSLHCGHSFCKECLYWWLDLNDMHATTTCPTCRRQHMLQGSSLGVNGALRACVEALFPEESTRRAQLVKGENGGAHDRGYEEISPARGDSWNPVGADGVLSVRRSIVLDASDQRMQFTIGLCGEPILEDNVLDIELAIMHMEEDEACYGIPIVIQEQGDEHLITKEERMNCFVDVIAVVRGDKGEEIFKPVERRKLGGTVNFYLDLAAKEELKSAVRLCFRHEETGAELELLVPKRRHAGEQPFRREMEGEEELTRKKRTLRGRRQRRLSEEIEDEEEEADMDEFEDDGFVVGDDHDSEEEHDDENDECYICHEGGNLLICDGGDAMPGCGRSVHIACIGRDIVPPGDWICESCANTAGMEGVGVEGFEFTGPPPTADDDLSKESETLPRDEPKRLKRKRLQDEPDDMSDEDEFDDKGPIEKNTSRLGLENDDSSREKSNMDDDDDEVQFSPSENDNKLSDDEAMGGQARNDEADSEDALLANETTTIGDSDDESPVTLQRKAKKLKRAAILDNDDEDSD